VSGIQTLDLGAALDADQRRREARREYEQRSRAADLAAAQEAAAAGKVICGHCGSHTAYAGERCDWCNEDPAAAGATCQTCNGEGGHDVDTRRQGSIAVTCPKCDGRGTVEPPCARLHELSVKALEERERATLVKAGRCPQQCGAGGAGGVERRAGR